MIVPIVIGGSGVSSDDCTANLSDVLTGYTAVTADSDDEPTEGTMPNNGAVNATVGVAGTYTVPLGYHNGNGLVKAESASIPSLKASEFYGSADFTSSSSSSTYDITLFTVPSNATNIICFAHEYFDGGFAVNGTSTTPTDGKLSVKAGDIVQFRYTSGEISTRIASAWLFYDEG